MKITFESREFTPTEKYLMTKSPSIISVKDVEDKNYMKVKGWLQYSAPFSNISATSSLSYLLNNSVSHFSSIGPATSGNLLITSDSKLLKTISAHDGKLE